VCPSEVSDVEAQIWQEYQSRGVVVWGIASQDERARVSRFKAQLGLTFPILYDDRGQVLNRYGRLRHSFGTVYPQDWIVGVDGKVAYVNPGYEPDEITAILDAELAR